MKRRSRKQLQKECDEWAEIAYIKTQHIQELEKEVVRWRKVAGRVVDDWIPKPAKGFYLDLLWERIDEEKSRHE